MPAQHTADEYVIKDEGSTFLPAPEGQYVAVCVDFVNLGDTVEQYMDNPPRLVSKGVLVFQIDERNPDTGKRFEPSVEKTLTFGEKAGLRKFLESWRGKAYTPDEAKKGAPLHKLVGQCGVVTIEHKTSAAGRVYARISNITPVMKGLAKIEPENYARSEHWAKKRDEYQGKARQFMAAAEVSHDRTDDAPPLDDDDLLPF
jgi:hypothetical protein